MSRIVYIPDTNFFINYPDFVSYFEPSRTSVHIDVVLPVLAELDKHRNSRRSSVSDKQDVGWKAYQAMNMIKYLQEHPSRDNEHSDLNLEIVRSDDIDSTLANDVQIVDYTVKIARDVHPNDEIVFITSDLGMPGILLQEERRRFRLKNLAAKTPEGLRKELPFCGTVSAKIDKVWIDPNPHKESQKLGLAIFVDFSISDFKNGSAWIAAHFSYDKGQALNSHNPSYRTVDKKLAIFQTIICSTVYHTERHFKLFLPYEELKDAHSRYGVAHLKLVVTLWDAEKPEQLAKSNYHKFDYSLRRHFLK